jgi:hypothetical protein
MSGIFSTWQPIYAEHGIATFPVGHAKKPGVRGWQRVGLKGSADLAAKFEDADALEALPDGREHNAFVGAPSSAGPPRSKANDRLTLELNYQSEDVKADRSVAARASHASLLPFRADHLTRRH